jgi:hypothetical protein
MKRALATLLLTACAPGLAAAQDITFSGGLTLGYGSHDVSDIS